MELLHSFPFSSCTCNMNYSPIKSYQYSVLIGRFAIENRVLFCHSACDALHRLRGLVRPRRGVLCADAAGWPHLLLRPPLL